MVTELAVSLDGAKENQDPKKMKIIIMINRLLETNAMQATQIEIIIVMETEPAVETDGVKEHQDDLSIP